MKGNLERCTLYCLFEMVLLFLIKKKACWALKQGCYVGTTWQELAPTQLLVVPAAVTYLILRLPSGLVAAFVNRLPL